MEVPRSENLALIKRFNIIVVGFTLASSLCVELGSRTKSSSACVLNGVYF